MSYSATMNGYRCLLDVLQPGRVAEDVDVETLGLIVDSVEAFVVRVDLLAGCHGERLQPAGDIERFVEVGVKLVLELVV